MASTVIEGFKVKYKFIGLIKTVDSVHTCKPLKRLDVNF